MNKLARFVLSLRRKNIFVSVASTRKGKPALGKFKRRWGPGRTVNLLRTFTQIKLCVMELKVKNNTIIFCLQLLVFYSFFFFSNLILKVTLLVSTETSSLAIVGECEIGRARQVDLICFDLSCVFSEFDLNSTHYF